MWVKTVSSQLLDGGTGHDRIEATIGRYLEEPSHVEAEFSAKIEAYGGKGNDTILASGGLDNLLDGGGGHDSLLGSENADLILGGNGADTLHGRSGDDTLSGGSGTDTFVFGASDTGTTTITDWHRKHDRLDLDFTDLNGNGLLDEVEDNTEYVFQGDDGHLILGEHFVIVFEDVRGRDFEDLFLNSDEQLL